MSARFSLPSPRRAGLLVGAGRALPIAAFPVTIFIAAFLLFEVEPMMGKLLLPWFGGAPSVWTTCMLFFQLLLLGGYAYAHLIGTCLSSRAQTRVHLTLVAVCLVSMTLLAIRWNSPIMPPASWKPIGPAHPALCILILLFTAVGLPYFTLSATAPLLQEWFAKSRRGSSPYRLYALSNFGAMLGLVTYPFAVEPALSLHRQARFWYLLYIVFALGLAASGLPLRSLTGSPLRAAEKSRARDATPNPGVTATPTAQFLWIALAACASLMFLAVTNQLCEDVAVAPFLWVLPLGIYLLSFIVCFGHEGCYRRAIFNPAMAAAIALTCAVLYRPYTGILWQTAIYSLLVGCSCRCATANWSG